MSFLIKKPHIRSQTILYKAIEPDLTVLIIEDDSFLNSIISQFLHSGGYKTLQAFSFADVLYKSCLTPLINFRGREASRGFIVELFVV